jgi:hypothetical protein
MRVNNQQTLHKRVQLPVVVTNAGESRTVIVNEGSMAKRASTENQSGLFRVFELIIEAAALAQPLNEEVAHFAMLAALVTGERLGIPDEVVNRMRDTAIAEAKRGEAGKSRRIAQACAKRG